MRHYILGLFEVKINELQDNKYDTAQLMELFSYALLNRLTDFVSPVEAEKMGDDVIKSFYGDRITENEVAECTD